MTTPSEAPLLARPASKVPLAPPASAPGSAAVPENAQSTDDKNKSKHDKNIYYWEPKSLRIFVINWCHVFRAVYLARIYHISIVVLALAILYRLCTDSIQATAEAFGTLAFSLAADAGTREAVAVVTIVVIYVMQLKPSIYCLENEVFLPPSRWQVTHAELQNMMRAQGVFTEESISFLERVLERSGTGEATHWPPGILVSKDGETKAETTTVAARGEAEAVMFPMVRELFRKTGLKPSEIDFLIVNCSIFTPTPSLCAMICNEFKLRQDVRSYNLGGMGCSANVISVDLAKQLLQNSPGTRALVISMENLTQNLYHGNDKSMLLQNTLFRAGGAAQLLSSCRLDAMRAKYKLLYTGRTQMSDDDSYRCVFEQEDADGQHGVALSKDIVKVAGRAMKNNFVALAPYVLPLREQLKVVYNRIIITMAGWAKSAGLEGFEAPKAYTPNFTKGIDHFCIHAGGRAVIEGVQKNLNLEDRHVQPSRQTLHDWGNTSSSSIWYEAEWIERFGNLQRGHRILQIAFGSGFKCNSAVWLALKAADKSKRGVPIKQNATANDAESAYGMVDKSL